MSDNQFGKSYEEIANEEKRCEDDVGNEYLDEDEYSKKRTATSAHEKHLLDNDLNSEKSCDDISFKA